MKRIYNLTEQELNSLSKEGIENLIEILEKQLKTANSFERTQLTAEIQELNNLLKDKEPTT